MEKKKCAFNTFLQVFTPKLVVVMYVGQKGELIMLLGER